MLFHFYCIDNPEKAHQFRLKKLQQHLDWVVQNMQSIKVAGPIKDSKSQNIIGSVYVVEADSAKQALAVLSEDPYHQAGIWQSISQQVFNDYAGTWVGGKNWPGTK
ncbi:YciI family protein [Thalassotalea sp. M1531]|uniref:YciI family protein n=1 Tax=Thalassotalea algicola TaxID=2716224 RepID=A0A7Y0L9I4_9GAMM|nr:YciI family protein [Thalassotalea algicola]NMP30134.1 YciI family protein [Thalassotalea algicola]